MQVLNRHIIFTNNIDLFLTNIKFNPYIIEIHLFKLPSPYINLSVYILCIVKTSLKI